MEENSNISLVPEEVLMSKIYLIRDKKVMLDRDLADLYGVETKVLKQAIRRNIKRFPSDFMFEMSIEELNQWRSQFVTSNSDKMGLRYPPFCFTEHGVIMLASILKSDRAIMVNVQIVRVFIKMREYLYFSNAMIAKMELLEKKSFEHDEKILVIFEFLKQLDEARNKDKILRERPKVGFRRNDEN